MVKSFASTSRCNSEDEVKDPMCTGRPDVMLDIGKKDHNTLHKAITFILALLEPSVALELTLFKAKKKRRSKRAQNS